MSTFLPITAKANQSFQFKSIHAFSCYLALAFGLKIIAWGAQEEEVNIIVGKMLELRKYLVPNDRHANMGKLNAQPKHFREVIFLELQ
jgi:hypothetical protein